MKRASICFLAFIFTIVFTGTSFGEIIFSDDFESYNVGDFPSKWTQQYSGDSIEVVNSPVASGTNALKIKGAPSWAANIYTNAGMPQGNRIIEADVWLTSNGVHDEGTTGIHFNGAKVTFMIVDSNILTAYFSNGTKNGAISANEWHHVKMIVDWDNSRYETIIDGISLYNGTFTKRTEPANTLNLWIHGSNSSASTRSGYWDNIVLKDNNNSVLQSPTLDITTSGTYVTISWTSVTDATGYTLYYAPYPDASEIGQIDIGNQTSLPSFDGKGYAFYVAVQAYNSAGSGGYSNIEYFDLIEAAVSIFTVDGLSFAKFWPGEQPNFRPSYLKDGLLSTGDDGMNLGVRDSDIYSFGLNCYDNTCGSSSWSGDANYSENYIGDLIDQLKYRHDVAKSLNKKFILVTHSWGTVLATIALGYLQDEYEVVPDLFITLSSPLGSINNTDNLDETFWTYDTDFSLFEPYEWIVNLISNTETNTVESWQNYIFGYFLIEYGDMTERMGSEMPYLTFVLPKASRWINYWAMGDIISGPLNTENGLLWCPTESGNSCVQDKKKDFSWTSRTYENTKIWHSITSLSKTKWDEFLDDTDKALAVEFRKQVANDILSVLTDN
jgi:hypothetical protein